MNLVVCFYLILQIDESLISGNIFFSVRKYWHALEFCSGVQNEKFRTKLVHSIFFKKWQKLPFFMIFEIKIEKKVRYA